MSRAAESHSRAGRTLGLPVDDYHAIVRHLRKGFPFKTYIAFQRESRLDRVVIGRVMRVPERTMARRKAEGSFKPDESERLLRLSRVFERALDLFEGDKDAAKRWLESPAKALGGETPLQAAETEIGAQEVDRLVGRIEHGIVA